MRINCVTSYKSSINLNQSPKFNKQNICFGSEDYGYNPFVDPELNNEASNPSLLNCIKYGIKLPFVIAGEIFGNKEEKRLEEIERLGRKFEEQEKREQAGLDKPDEPNIDDGLFYDDNDHDDDL